MTTPDKLTIVRNSTVQRTRTETICTPLKTYITTIATHFYL